MHPKKAARLLKDGHITQDEHDGLVAQYNAQKAERDNAAKAEAWLQEVENASFTQKKKMIKDKVIDLRVESALTEDNYEARQKRRTASSLNFALRGTGGVSF